MTPSTYSRIKNYSLELYLCRLCILTIGCIAKACLGKKKIIRKSILLKSYSQTQLITDPVLAPVKDPDEFFKNLKLLSINDSGREIFNLCFSTKFRRPAVNI
jgi:hypothetical protein